MFKRKVEVRLVKDTDKSTQAPLVTEETTSHIATMAKEVVKIVGVGAVVVIFAGVTMNVVAELIVNRFTD